MAVSKNVAPKVTIEPQGAPVAAEPSPEARIRLVNGCSTYVTPEREVFYAKDSEGNPRVYSIPRENLGRMLSYADDWGRRFFKQTNAETTDTRPDDTTKVTAPSKPAAVAQDFDGDGKGDEADDNEIDTGAMRLTDRDGKSVGVKV
jgi:hypothetical protein